MEKQLVADLVAKARVESSFAVRSASLAEFRNKPGHYLNLSLGDKTGDIAGRAWDNAEELAEVCQPGNVVWICGRVDEYQGKTQLIVDTAELVPASHVDPGDYLPTSTRDPLDMMDELDAVIETVEEPYLKALLHAFFADSTFRTKFAHGAGAKALHHSFVSGLLEHTLSVVMILRAVHDRHPQLDLDLLTAGAILHDVGKTEELSVDTRIDYTDAGRLLGHTVLTDRMVREQMEQIPDFPEQLANLLVHMLLSHHGQKEYGAPIVPMTAEACALHYADNLDAHVQYFSQVVEKGTGSGNRWSDYQRLFDRYIYIGDAAENADEPEQVE